MRRVLALFICMILVTPLVAWHSSGSGKNPEGLDGVVRVEEINH